MDDPQGAITNKAYIEQILEVEVKKWGTSKEIGYVLEQDGASGHGGSGGPQAKYRNPVAKWFRDHGVKTFFNYHDSPDLAPIENCWQGPKQYQRKRPHWDQETLRELLREGWDQVSQPYINSLVLSMPQRLRDVQRLQGVKQAGR